MSDQSSWIRVRVVYCPPGGVWERELRLPAGATVRAAIETSGVLVAFPQLDGAAPGAGVFGRPRQPDAVLHDGDRVEIYRPLQVDPKQARRHRAALRSRRRPGPRAA